MVIFLNLLLQNNEKEAHERIDWFLEHFGRDRFFLEVQPEEQKEQKIINQKLYDIGCTTNIRCVVGCDAHYPTLEDKEAHEIMLAIQTHAKMNDRRSI